MRPCFNPCFCGIRSTAAAAAAQASRDARFQSLFLWNSLNGIPPAIPRRPGFRFQSLFLWNSLNGSAISAVPWPASKRFQSLFLWNSLNGRRGGTRASWPRGFNPCFCGIRSTAQPGDEVPERRGRQPDVSILVFVEFAQRRPRRSSDTSPARKGFNPCFCGIRSTARRAGAPWATSSRFNPCFCGIRSTAISLPTSLMARYGFQSLFLWNSLNGAAWTDLRSSQ